MYLFSIVDINSIFLLSFQVVLVFDGVMVVRESMCWEGSRLRQPHSHTTPLPHPPTLPFPLPYTSLTLPNPQPLPSPNTISNFQTQFPFFLPLSSHDPSFFPPSFSTKFPDFSPGFSPFSHAHLPFTFPLTTTMFRSSRLRVHTCKIVLVTSLVWFVMDVAVIMYYSDCSTGSGWGCGKSDAQERESRADHHRTNNGRGIRNHRADNHDVDLQVSRMIITLHWFIMDNSWRWICENEVKHEMELESHLMSRRVITGSKQDKKRWYMILLE